MIAFPTKIPTETSMKVNKKYEIFTVWPKSESCTICGFSLFVTFYSSLAAVSKSYRVDPCCWRPGPLSLVCNAMSQPGALCSPICQAHQHMHAPPSTPSLCSDPPSRHKARSPDACFPFPGHYWAIKAWSGIWRSEAKEAILR